MRSHPFKPLRCEFKFIPMGQADFAHNGIFDITIFWSLPAGRSKQQLNIALLKKNGCAEIIVLEEMKAFRDLPTYTVDALSRMGSNDIIRKLILKREFPSVFALCIATRLYPETFQMDRMVGLLSSRFPFIKKMAPRGRAMWYRLSFRLSLLY